MQLETAIVVGLCPSSVRLDYSHSWKARRSALPIEVGVLAINGRVKMLTLGGRGGERCKQACMRCLMGERY